MVILYFEAGEVLLDALEGFRRVFIIGATAPFFARWMHI